MADIYDYKLHGKSHVALEASAGTGKTHNITQIIIPALVEEGVLLENIAVVTFTEKAAAELSARIRAGLSGREGAVWGEALWAMPYASIGTIHSLCRSILKSRAALAGISPRYEETESEADIAAELFERYWAEMEKDSDPQLGALLAAAGLKNIREISLDAVRALKGRHAALGEGHELIPFLEKFINGFTDRFNSHMLSADLVSRDGLLVLTADLLEKDGAAVAEKYPYIIVDECQDTSPVQTRIFSALARAGSRLVLVGDPKQSIYSFQNADLENYVAFQQNMVGADNRLVLDETRRSTVMLTDAFNSSFQRLFDGSFPYVPVRSLRNGENPKPPVILLGADGDGNCIHEMDGQALTADSVREYLAGDIAGTIAYLVSGDSGYTISRVDNDGERHDRITPGDIAVLYPSGGALRFLVRALAARGISVSVYKHRELYSDSLVGAVSSMLSCIGNPNDEMALYKTLESDLFQIPREELLAFSGGAGMSFFSESGSPGLDRILGLLRRGWQEKDSRDAGQIVMDILEGSGRLNVITSGFDGDRNFTNLQQLCEILAAGQLAENLTFDEAARRLRDNVENGTKMEMRMDTDENTGAVRLMSMHASKGLEFPVVFLYNIHSSSNRRAPKIYPEDTGLSGQTVRTELSFGSGSPVQTDNYAGLDDKKRKEEEEERRRLLYVAMTRARDYIVLPLYTPGSRAGFMQKLLNSSLPGKEFCTILGHEFLQGFTLAAVEPDAPSVPEPELPAVADRAAVAREKAGRKINSYTSCSAGKKQAAPLPEIGDEARAEAEGAEERVLRYYLARHGSSRKGAMFGDICHRILDAAEYSGKNPDDIRKNVGEAASLIYRNVFLDDENYNRETALELCTSALLKKYNLNGKECVPADWENPEKERQFYLSAGGSRFIGIGDLMFRFDNYWYILDWKTTLIREGYSPENMAANVKENYSTQSVIYCANLLLNMGYLSDPAAAREDWERQFGGMIFVYLRETADFAGYHIEMPSFETLEEFIRDGICAGTSGGVNP